MSAVTRVRLDVENFATTLHLLDNDRSISRHNVTWIDDDTCTSSADRVLDGLGYQRTGDWTKRDGSRPSHPIGDRPGQYFNTIEPAATPKL